MAICKQTETSNHFSGVEEGATIVGHPGAAAIVLSAIPLGSPAIDVEHGGRYRASRGDTTPQLRPIFGEDEGACGTGPG